MVKRKNMYIKMPYLRHSFPYISVQAIDKDSLASCLTYGVWLYDHTPDVTWISLHN